MAPLAIAMCMAAVGWPISAWADMANPWQPGDAVGEPAGTVARIAITHEDLVFDLRPLADANPVQVHATYMVRNDAASTTELLVFLADHALTQQSSFSVTFDGASISATPTTLTQLPDAWKPPTSTPSTIDGVSIPYNTVPGTAFRFTVVIPPGPHRLSVGYSLLSGRYAMPGQTIIWQVAYVLAPARQWASFGDLMVQAQLPAGWRARAVPILTRRGDSLVGHFVGLPADGLVMSASFPEDPHVAAINQWLVTEWPLLAGLLVIMVAGAAAVPRFTKERWFFVLCGPMLAFPVAVLRLASGYTKPPGTQYTPGKLDFLLDAWVLFSGAAGIAVVAAVIGVLAVAIPMFVAAPIWARWRRPA